jgi:tetratricopeptide (TPR) repeat protein
MAYCGRGAVSTETGEFDKAIASFDEAIRLDPQIANMSFYKRYRAAAQFPWSPGLSVAVLLLTFGVCLFVAFAVWPTLRHRKPEVDKDF